MFKVKSSLPGILSLSVEKGSISIGSGKICDLELTCSRKFIKNDHTIQRLLHAGHLVLVFDSEAELPKHDLTSLPKVPEIAKTKGVVAQHKAVKEPEVIHAPIVIDLTTNTELPGKVTLKKNVPVKVEEPKVEVKEVVVEEVKEEVASAKFSKSELKRMSKDELNEVASNLKIENADLSKKELIDAILSC